MATSPSNTIPTTMPILATIAAFPPPNLTFNEKLEGPIYLSCLTQFLPIMCSIESMGIVDGTDPCPPQFLVDDSGKQVPNPKFTIWQRKD